MFKYRLCLEDGSEVGEAAYTQHIKAGEIVWAAGTRQFRVVHVVPVEDVEGSPYVGLLKVEAA
jgi:NADH dehydrogenase FAD-containing subunit